MTPNTNVLTGETTGNNQRSRKPLVMILLMFLTPVVLSLVLQQFDWRSEVKTHGSQLVAGGQSYDSLGLENPLPGQWQLVYHIDNHCDQQCLNSLYAQQQVWQALAADRKRLTPVVLMSSQQALPEDPTLNPQLFITHKINKQQVQNLSQLSNTVYLFDTLGQQVLSYRFAPDKEQAIHQAKELLLDVKQLLKLSRIG